MYTITAKDVLQMWISEVSELLWDLEIREIRRNYHNEADHIYEIRERFQQCLQQLVEAETKEEKTSD